MSEVRLQCRVVQIHDPAVRESVLWQQTGNPFMSPGWLGWLEDSGCVAREQGWQPQHLGWFSGEELVAFMPAYLKFHSAGEYVFDWAWADAYRRYGHRYYPKLLTAIPFTPSVGPRLLSLPQHPPDTLWPALATFLEAGYRSQRFSSWHLLFADETLNQALGVATGQASAEAVFEAPALMPRRGVQYHWSNPGYADFDAFLATLNSRKRKNMRKERRKVEELGLRLEWRQGQTLDRESLAQFYPLYADTYFKRGQAPYLSPAFFEALPDHCGQHLALLLAWQGDTLVAGSLFFEDGETLYGRYWGSREDYRFLHFECCYYQGIDRCIEKGLKRFDAGAQGEHKLLRGFEPVLTTSWHWIGEPAFERAIADFLDEEREATLAYRDSAATYLPYRQAQGNTTPDEASAEAPNTSAPEQERQ